MIMPSIKLIKSISCLFVFLLLFCSCANKKTTSILDENLYMLSLDKVTLNLKPLDRYSKGFNGYIYVMNSECSECIGNFISFAKELDMSGYHDSLIAVISIATQPIVNHYIKECDFAKRMKILLLEDSEKQWGINSIEEENGTVYYVRENQIKAVYQYFPKRES